jgi:hypothetical protein
MCTDLLKEELLINDKEEPPVEIRLLRRDQQHQEGRQTVTETHDSEVQIVLRDSINAHFSCRWVVQGTIGMGLLRPKSS